MERTKSILANGISIEQMIGKFGKRAPHQVAFLTDGSCVDTWPPIPGGGK